MDWTPVETKPATDEWCVVTDGLRVSLAFWGGSEWEYPADGGEGLHPAVSDEDVRWWCQVPVPPLRGKEEECPMKCR